MSMPTHHKGKALSSSSELIALNDEPSATPSPVTHASTSKDEDWLYALTVLQSLSLQENNHAASHIGGALMTKTDSRHLLSRPFAMLFQDYCNKTIMVKC